MTRPSCLLNDPLLNLAFGIGHEDTSAVLADNDLLALTIST